MYYEDRFDPNNTDEDVYSTDDANNKKVYNILAESSKGYFRVTRKAPVSKGKNITNTTNLKNKRIGLYASGQQGCTITNAVTGEKCTGHLVGSKNEDFYFKVKLSTGETGQLPINLFYKSPEEYERHLYDVVHQNTKTGWSEKNSKAVIRMMNTKTAIMM